MTDRISIPEFCTANRITITSKRTSSNPHMLDSANMDHWKVTLHRARKQMTLVFSMGYCHGGSSPEVADVLNCLASDSASVANSRGFEDWASELGYDTDSRKAERTYQHCEAQATKLELFLGSALYNQLIWNTEAL